jgi:hypothetical protein
LMTQLMKDKRVLQLIEGAKFQVFITADYHDKATDIIVPYRTLIDIVPNSEGLDRNYVCDFKTSRHLEPRLWRNIVHEHHYEAQAWQNLELWNGATGEGRDSFVHIISKNTHPFTVGRRLLTQENLEVGKLKVLNALRLYCQCIKNKSWPSFEELASIYAPEEHLLDGWLTTSPATWIITKMQEQAWGAISTEPENIKPSDDEIIP